MITSILSAVIIFAVLIVVHETGHFLMAKRSGVRVIRYSVGYPPKIFGIRRGETEYALGATPLGGYVRMLGDEVAEEPTPETLEGYVREVQLDLLEAVRRQGRGASLGSEATQVVSALAQRWNDAREIGTGAAGHGAALATASASAAGASEINELLGRDVRPEEALLLAEVGRRNSVEEAIKALVEARSPALLDR